MSERDSRSGEIDEMTFRFGLMPVAAFLNANFAYGFLSKGMAAAQRIEPIQSVALITLGSVCILATGTEVMYIARGQDFIDETKPLLSALRRTLQQSIRSFLQCVSRR